MVRYSNPLYNPAKPEYGPEYYETSAKPIFYRGYRIYHRVKSKTPGGNVWDIVIFDSCVTQMAGLDGAKRAIDKMIDASD